MRKVTVFLAFWVFCTLTALSQGSRPGWTEYRINGGEVVLSLPNSMKVFESKKKGFSAVKDADGSYSVRNREEILFVPLADSTDYDKEEDMNINNMVVVMVDGDEDGLGKVIELMKKNRIVRSVAGWGLKMAVGLERSKDDKLKVTNTTPVILKKIAGRDAISMGMGFKDKNGRSADGEVYLIENKGKGIVLAFLNEKGRTGFTKKDHEEVLSLLRLK